MWAGLKRELGNVGRDMTGFFGVRGHRGSAAVARRTELTGRVYGAASEARRGE